MDKISTTPDLNMRELDFSSLFSALWRDKIVIGFTTFVISLSAVAYSLYLPNIYQSVATMAPQASGSASRLEELANRYSGLASLAGVNIGGAGRLTESQIAMEITKTLTFFESFLYREVVAELAAVAEWDSDSGDLIYDNALYDPKGDIWTMDEKRGRSNKPTLQEAHEIFLEHFSVTEDLNTSLVTFSVTHQSPVVAKEWLELVLDSIDKQAKEDSIRESQTAIDFLKDQRNRTELVFIDEVFAQLIEEQFKSKILAEGSSNYLFRAIQPPYIPEKKIQPNRAWICISSFLIAFIGCCILSIARVFSKILDRS